MRHLLLTMKGDAMTELTKQERDEAFITLVLTREDAELYRRYGATTREEMDRSGIPDLSLKIESMFSKLILAGLLDKDCHAPYEKTSPDEYFFRRTVDGGPDCGFKYGFTFSEFLILRGGRTVCYDTISWHEAVKYILRYNDLEPWKMDDEPMVVRFAAEEWWYEVHPRREIPALLDAFKDYLQHFFTDVIALGSEEEPPRCPFTFPMRQFIDFKIPCEGGLKIALPRDDKHDGLQEWLGFEALPLTCADKGILAAVGERDIRSVRP